MEDEKPRLALLKGSKGSADWLWQLPLGTVFLAKEYKNPAFVLGMFQIVEKSTESVRLLIPNYNPGPVQYIWVDPITFSSSMEQKEVLALGQEDEHGSEDDGSPI